MESDLYLESFFEWMRENSHKVGYPRLVYFYSDGGVDAKLLLKRLMFHDSETEWGWSDDWVEYNSAVTFASRAESYRSKIEDAQNITLKSCDSSGERLNCWHHLPWVTLALFDVERLAGNSSALNSVFGICKALVERRATVLLTGTRYPCEEFKEEPQISRFLLNGYVVKIEGDRIVFQGGRSVLVHDLPFYGLLEYGFDYAGNESFRFPVSDCDELLFQWELLCTWRVRYGLFDSTLFKDAFIGAWRFLLTKPSAEDYGKMSSVRIRLLSLMSGFNGGPICWKFCLFNDDGPLGSGVSCEDHSELIAADVFVLELISNELKDKLYKGDGLLKFRFPIVRDKSRFHAAKIWKASVSLHEFCGAFADLVSELGTDHA